MFGGRKLVSQDRALAPLFTLQSAFVRGAHRFPGDPLRMADMFGRASPSLLMNQIEVADGRLSVSILFKERRLGDQFVSGRYSVIARVGNISGAIFLEFGPAELE